MVKMGAVWDRTTKFLRSHGGPAMTIAAIAILAPTILSTILQGAITGGDPAAAMSPGVGIVNIVATVITLLGQIALVALAIDATLGAGGAFSVAGRRLLPVIGVSLLLGLVFFVLFLPVIFILMGAGIDWVALGQGDASSMSGLGGSAALLGLYFIVLIPVMFWISARFSVLLPVIVWERRGVGALARAFALTKGYALRIIGIFVLGLILFMVAGAAIGGVFGAILALTTGSIEGLTVGGVLMAIITGLLTAVFTVIYTVFLTKLYKSLIEETEPAAVFE